MMLAAQRNLFTGSFNPLSLSPALWLSDTGSNAGQWDDLSGNGRHATQATAANQPAIVTGALNGRQVRRFDGTTDHLITASFSLSQAYTSYVVYKAALTSLNKLVLRSVSSSPTTVPVTHRSVAGNTSGLNCGTGYFPLPTIDTWQIFGTIANGSSSIVRRNGGSDNTGDAGTNALAGGLIIGNAALLNSGLDGDIAEILVFPAALSTENRRRIEGYLSSKYAIAIS